MKYQNLDNLILFGGSRLLADFVDSSSRSLPYELVVFSSKRHLDEAVAGSSKTLRQILKKNRINFYESPNINQEKNLKNVVSRTTLGIAFGASWVFEKKTVKLFRPRHLLDFMGIDLPRYRGGAHYSWMILHQNRRGAANLQVIEGGQDSFHRGPVIKRLEYDLPAKLEQPVDYFDFMSAKELSFLRDFFREIRNKKDFKPVRLKENESAYYPFLATERQGFINWQWKGEDIYLFIKAFDDPYLGAATYLGQEKVFLRKCSRLAQPETYHPFTSGIVVRKDKPGGIFVATQGNLLHIEEVWSRSGKNLISKIELGQRFYTPSKILDEAMIFQAHYNSSGLV